MYISLQSPQKTLPERRLRTVSCESNDDRMDKNSLMYAAVTKVTNYQNKHTGSLTTTYRCVDIKLVVYGCLFHTLSFFENTAYHLGWKWIEHRGSNTLHRCKQMCRSHSQEYRVVMMGWPDVSIKASFSAIISQMLLEVMVHYFKALITYSCSGPPGKLPLARTTLPNPPSLNLLMNWILCNDTFPSLAVSNAHWQPCCGWELQPTNCKFCTGTLVLAASSSFWSSWFWMTRIFFSSQSFIFDSHYLFRLLATFTRSSSVRSFTSVPITLSYFFWSLLLITLNVWSSSCSFFWIIILSSRSFF